MDLKDQLDRLVPVDQRDHQDLLDLLAFKEVEDPLDRQDHRDHKVHKVQLVLLASVHQQSSRHRDRTISDPPLPTLSQLLGVEEVEAEDWESQLEVEVEEAAERPSHL
jgi:hypothetical protein